MSVDEALDMVRAMVSDRSLPERERRALEIVLRIATRGRHISSNTLPAAIAASQHFIKAREHIDAGLTEAARFAPAREPDPKDD